VKDVFGADWVASKALLETDVASHQLAWQLSEYVKQIGAMAEGRKLKPDWETFQVRAQFVPGGVQFALRVEVSDEG
jgi:hypothetical protein